MEELEKTRFQWLCCGDQKEENKTVNILSQAKRNQLEKEGTQDGLHRNISLLLLLLSYPTQKRCRRRWDRHIHLLVEI